MLHDNPVNQHFSQIHYNNHLFIINIIVFYIIDMALIFT